MEGGSNILSVYIYCIDLKGKDSSNIVDVNDAIPLSRERRQWSRRVVCMHESMRGLVYLPLSRSEMFCFK